MSKPYLNDFDKSQKANFLVHKMTVWNQEDIESLHEAFSDKGYIVAPLSRVFTHTNHNNICEAYRYDALVIPRHDSYIIEEYLSTQRIDFYRQAEKCEGIALVFINQTSADEILKNLKFLPRGDIL